MVRVGQPLRRNRDETVLVHTRRHAKALFWPVVVGFIGIVGAAALLGLMPTAMRTQYWPIVAALAATIVIIGTVVPWLTWFTTTMTITDRRVMLRHGVVVRRGHDIMVDSLVDVSWQAGISDRMMGCGRLILTSASDQMVLNDVPGPRRIADLLAELTDGEYAGYGGYLDDDDISVTAR
ncbi:PH domain-containing protein [Cutibacterium sp. WCA-380-WT-3A]|uniref:PH domain-containing protein n=1 Tax=Cutibacterium porci TaxID=2605781 RepID=A0A7K0J7M7_9ACTN|nr:PH domain-containing protein [Cutibacterium porci]MSS45965.1 PH domain-containing protein [Cutibacterium porci]